jgi:phosphohistidine phosphatase
MKTLFVLRHAKASEESPSGSDFDRPLTSSGKRAAAAIGRALGASEPRTDAILASPAQRVIETVAGVAQAAGLNAAPGWDRRLYNASVQDLIAAIGETDDEVATLLLVGHNPGLKELIGYLATDDPAGLRAEVRGRFATATLAELRLTIDRWREIEPGCGRIEHLVRPGDPAPAQAES